MILSYPGFPIAGIAFALRQSNMAGKVIVAVLFVGSIFAWSVMVAKIKELRQGRLVSRRFLAAYRKEGHPASLFLKRQKYEASSLYAIYERTCIALGAALESRGAEPGDLFMGGVGSDLHRLDEVQISYVRNVAERTMADEALLLENNMGLLATAASTAPFLGLLGTVWGVMEAFGGMAVSGTAMLSEVAPGISGALLTTVVGLLVALPSAIGYNALTDRIRRMGVEMDNFLQELSSDIERHYLQMK
jgi:biopolymer transport protein TolQ